MLVARSQYDRIVLGADDLEAERLSLPNAYAINRGVLDYECGCSIIREYVQREETSKFSEWFSIDPPYAQFHLYKDGEYVNGALSPFTAGELARGAFEYGFEEYGWDIISRMMKLAERDGTVYFLYYPDSTPQPQGGPSAWGAASFVNAIEEGLAGVKNVGVRYDRITLQPAFSCDGLYRATLRHGL